AFQRRTVGSGAERQRPPDRAAHWGDMANVLPGNRLFARPSRTFNWEGANCCSSLPARVPKHTGSTARKGGALLPPLSAHARQQGSPQRTRHEPETCDQRATRSPHRHPDVLHVFLDVPPWFRDKHVHCRAHSRSNHPFGHLVYRFIDCPVETESRLI